MLNYPKDPEGKYDTKNDPEWPICSIYPTYNWVTQFFLTWLRLPKMQIQGDYVYEMYNMRCHADIMMTSCKWQFFNILGPETQDPRSGS